MVVISKPGKPEPYCHAILRAGAHASEICLAAHENPGDLDRMRGLVLTGGADIDPPLYGESLRYGEDRGRRRQVKTDRLRDDFELALLRRACERRLPVLAICRGLQLANVYFGGTLYQDLFADGATPWEHRQPEERDEPTHQVRLLDGDSLLRRALGDAALEDVAVNSFHHQGIKALGRGLHITARAVEDELPEAFELDDSAYPFFLAVQWHPEELTGRPEHLALFQSFLAAVG